MASDKPGRVVFIGNIPYGLTEEQIIDILNTVGKVVSFRLVYDNDTGKPKGFGFAEFSDTDAAASAVRNLNNHQIMGRELRVDFSHVGGKEEAVPAGYNTTQNVQPPSNGYNPQSQPSTTLPALPPGVDLQPGLTCPDAISKTLNTLPPPQLLDILSQMKGLVVGDPAKATELLKQAPQLSYAIFQALLLMGLVDTSVLASVVEQAAGGPPQPSMQQQQQQQVPQRPPFQQASLPQQPPNYNPYPQIPGQQQVPTPPVYGAAYAPPPPVPQPQPPQQQPDPQQLIKQVLSMPQSSVDALPPAERAQIMALRQQYGGGMTGY